MTYPRSTILGGATLCRVAAACVALLWVLPTRADQIVVGKQNYRGARIRTLEDGQLRFRSAEGMSVAVHIGDIDLIIVDRTGVFDDFNEAERFLASGEPAKAAARYERALKLSTDFWSELIAARLIIAYDRADQIDKATGYFVRLARGKRSGARAAARLIPQRIPQRRTAKFGRAIRELDLALAAAPEPLQHLLFALVRFKILKANGDRRATSAAMRAIALPIAASIRSEQVYTILTSAFREVLGGATTVTVRAALDRAIRDCPESVLADFLLIKGESLLRSAKTREEVIRAAWPFMRVVIHMGDDTRAADALFGAATALEQLGNRDRARVMLSECLAHVGASEKVKSQAQAMLARLRTGTSR